MTEEEKLEQLRAKLLEKYFPTKAIVESLGELKGAINQLIEKEAVINVDKLEPNIHVEPTPINVEKTEIDYDKMPQAPNAVTILNPNDIKSDIKVEKVDIKPIVIGLKALESSIKDFIEKASSSPLLDPLQSIADSVQIPDGQTVKKNQNNQIIQYTDKYPDRIEITTIDRFPDGKYRGRTKKIIPAVNNG